MSTPDAPREAGSFSERLSRGGPRSARGRSASKRNSLKHGFSGAGACLPEAMQAEVDAEHARYRDTYQPRDRVEDRCLGRMAQAVVRQEHIRAQQRARAARRRRAALARFDTRRDKLVAGHAARLTLDPAAAVAGLLETAEGCDLLADQWDEIKDALEKGPLTQKLSDRAVALLGLSERGKAGSDPEVAGWTLDLLAATAPRPRYLLAEYFGVRPDQSAEKAPPIEAARAALLARVTAEVAALQARADELWRTRDEPDRDEAADRTLVDTSPTGALLERYYAAAGLEYRRASQELFTHRKAMEKQAEEGRPPADWLAPRNEPEFVPQVVADEAAVVALAAALRRDPEPFTPPPVAFETPRSDEAAWNPSTAVDAGRPEPPLPPR